jgi:hypothetical protein
VDDRLPTTRARAKRIDLSYWKRLHPFRRTRLVLSIAAPVVAAVWVGVHAVQGDQRLYTSGPVSTAHAMFGAACGECHQAAAAPGRPAERAAFFVRVSDQACGACHAGPVHHEAQTSTPACASCHLEHEGHVVLGAIGDRHCTACHARLETRTGAPPRFATAVSGFATDHPEFSVSLADRRVRLGQVGGARDLAQV